MWRWQKKQLHLLCVVLFLSNEQPNCQYALQSHPHFFSLTMFSLSTPQTWIFQVVHQVHRDFSASSHLHICFHLVTVSTYCSSAPLFLLICFVVQRFVIVISMDTCFFPGGTLFCLVLGYFKVCQLCFEHVASCYFHLKPANYTLSLLFSTRLSLSIKHQRLISLLAILIIATWVSSNMRTAG